MAGLNPGSEKAFRLIRGKQGCTERRLARNKESSSPHDQKSRPAWKPQPYALRRPRFQDISDARDCTIRRQHPMIDTLGILALAHMAILLAIQPFSRSTLCSTPDSRAKAVGVFLDRTAFDVIDSGHTIPAHGAGVGIGRFKVHWLTLAAQQGYPASLGRMNSM